MSTTVDPSVAAARRVAVIAVHGVADQQPGETAIAIANLLTNLDDQGRPAYGPFESKSIRVPVRSLEVPDRAAHVKQNWAERAASYGAQRAKASEGGSEVDAGLEFMASLMAKYEPSGPDETYETSVLRSRRSAGATGEAEEVDVYEMYWADLSRLTQSWLRIFAEIYQLLFHLASLGAHAVRAAQASEPSIKRSGVWRTWARAQRAAADVLAQYVVLMNLFLVGLLLVLLAALPSEPLAAVTVWTVYAVLAIVVTGVLSYRRYAHAESVRGVVGMVLGLAAVVFGVLWWIDWPDRAANLALATILAAAVSAVIAAIVSRYNRHRPGVSRTAVWLGGPLVAWLLVELWLVPHGEEPRVQAAVLHSAEYVYAALRVAFVVFLAFAWVAHRAGKSTVDETEGAANDRLRRLNWTARLTLSLPAVLFLLATTVLWYTLWQALQNTLGGVLANTHQLAWLTHTVVVPELNPSAAVNDFVNGLISNGSGHGIGLLMLSVLLAVLLAVYAMWPSVLLEVRAPSAPRDGTRSGRWLDAGFRLTRWAGRLLVFGVLIVLPAGTVAGMILSRVNKVWFGQLAEFNFYLLVAAAAILGPAGAGLVLFGNRLKSLTLGFRNVVDVALDVDNYLREHPRESNPRARIATRMASLLRYVYAQNYSSVVIIAHSQGTVITADLLRFLHKTGLNRADEGLALRQGRPISFFTMGSPLRQLYGLRFPHLYRWARHHEPGPWTNPAETIGADTGPDPAELDLVQWVNAYRSADYVGRYLWRPERCDFNFKTAPIQTRHPWPAGPFEAIASQTEPPLRNRREFCIGSGAHQHYWDGTAPQIALELDALIRS